MFAKTWQWTKRKNLYVLAAGLGLFGLVDTITPGPSANHAIGLAIMATAAFMWLVQ